MATINLTQIWIHDAADLSSYITADVLEVQPSFAIDGEVRTYAGGRRRLITRAGRSRSLPLTLELVAAADVAQLEAWAGQLLMVRAPQGLLMFGSFLGLEAVWRAADEAEAVSLAITEITTTIEV